MVAYNIEAFLTVKECLTRSDYKRIQYFPGHRRRLGREFFLFRSCILKNNTTLLRGSALYPLYKQLMQNLSPLLYNQYKFFFLSEELPLTLLSEFLSQHELDILTKNELIYCIDDSFICNYRFVPIKDQLIVVSPLRDRDTPNYVYIGPDSIIMMDLLSGECNKKVMDVLEIGCGTGLLSLWMSKFGQNVKAIDINPRALEITELNATINGVNNIFTKSSEIYSEVQDEFDIIISNPPYIFLPEEYDDRIFEYGGDLALEIVEKIFQGLDDGLKVDGVTLLFCNSYIKHGVNTLIELVRSVFHGKSYLITLKQIDYQQLIDHLGFYKAHGISHSIRYWVKIEKAPSYKLNHIPLRGAHRLLESFKIKQLSGSKWS